MITQFIIVMVTGLVSSFLNLLPEWGRGTDALTGFDMQVGTFAAKANGYVPEVMLFTCLGILLAIKLFFLVWRGILFIYSLIPFN